MTFHIIRNKGLLMKQTSGCNQLILSFTPHLPRCGIIPCPHTLEGPSFYAPIMQCIDCEFYILRGQQATLRCWWWALSSLSFCKEFQIVLRYPWNQESWKHWICGPNVVQHSVVFEYLMGLFFGNVNRRHRSPLSVRHNSEDHTSYPSRDKLA